MLISLMKLCSGANALVSAHQSSNICHGYTRGTGPESGRNLIPNQPDANGVSKGNHSSRKSFSPQENGAAVSINML